jgi:Fic family protein
MKDIDQLITQYRTVMCRVDELQHQFFNEMAVVYHSNAIENSTLTLDETILLLEHRLSPNGKPLADIFMAEDHYQALKFILEMAYNKRALSHESIKEVASKLMKNTGGVVESISGSFDVSKGEYRKVLVRAGQSVFPDPNKVPLLMEEFIHSINASMDKVKSPIEIYNLSFDAHFQAVSIHPFGDGNGRFSRLMMNYIQAYHQMPLVYMDQTDKQRYFDTLVQSRASQNIDLFRTYMLELTVKSIEEQIAFYNKKSFHASPKNDENGKFLSLLF